MSIDGGAPQAAPFSQVVKPGKHRVRVEAAGFFPEEQEVVAVEGSLVPVTVDLRERPARVTFAGGDGGDVYIDGRFVGTTPLPHPLELSSGEHLVAVAKTGTKGVAFPITLERAKDRVVPVRLEQTSQRLAAYVVLGTSAAALVTGAVFTGLALGAEGEASGLRDKARRENLTPDELARANDALEGRDGYRSAAGASFAVAAGLAAVGAVLYFFDRPNLAAPALDRGGTPAPPPKGDTPMMEVSVLPAVGPTGAGAAVLGRF